MPEKRPRQPTKAAKSAGGAEAKPQRSVEDDLPQNLAVYEVSDGDETDSDLSEYSGLESEEDGGSDEKEGEETGDLSGEGDEEESEGDDEGDGESSEADDDVESSGGILMRKADPETEEYQEDAVSVGASSAVDADTTDYDIEGAEPGAETESDDEEVKNTVGNIPMEWYNDFPHIGYNLDGQKVMRPAKGDELDLFLEKMDNPDFWRTVHDKQNQQDVVLTEEELAIIQRIQGGQFPDANFDPYEPYVDFFTGETRVTPLGAEPEPKRRFLPSKWEHKRVMKIVRAIRNGWIKPKGAEVEKPRYYPIWTDSDQPRAEHPMNAPAPKMKLPGHEESYNPPEEYLPTPEEIDEWENTDPQDRKRNFLPKKYASLRLVPRYDNYIQERFERCLDLYLCPRARKTRLNIDPETLIPKLPKPRDLQPFPTMCAVVYKGHVGKVRSVSFSPSGQWAISGGDDKTARLWEVITGRCIRTYAMDDAVVSVAWNPNKNVELVAVCAGNAVALINPMIGASDQWEATDVILSRAAADNTDDGAAVSWGKASTAQHVQGYRIVLGHAADVVQAVWHHKGDYLATVTRDATKSVVIHQLTKRRSQMPFKKSKGEVQCVQFHPSRPFFLVATQRYIRVYNLAKQELSKKLVTGVKWISSMDVHPGGDNVIIGSYDRRLCWFDLDLSNKPYKTLRYHDKALRAVSYHQRYPLFASASDDGSVHVFHGRVFSDLLQNPLIVPVKKLEGHDVTGGLGVMDCKFHPTQPWLLSAAADGTLRLWT